MNQANSDSERLARIETKLDVLIGNDQDKEQRMRVLEYRDAYVLGGAVVLSFAGPLILKKVFGL
jgi:hypothetical protein